MKRPQILLLYAAAAMAAFMPAANAATPILSGSYVYTWIEACVGDEQGYPTVSQTVGVITFTPASTRATHGKATLKAYQVGNIPPDLSHESGTRTYSNTAATFTFNDNAYYVFYGNVTNGIANYLSYINLVTGNENVPCEDEAWLSHQ